MMQKIRTPLFLAIALLPILSAFASPPDQPSATPQDVFDAMQASFRADKAAGVNARYQFEITGARGGVWSTEVKDNRCRFQKAAIEKPDVTLVASDADWVAIANGKLNGVWAGMTGRLKVRGNHALARKLEELFP